MKRLTFLRVTLLPLLLAAGCSGGGSGGPATQADFCTQYADKICKISALCGIAQATCTAYQTSQCTALANAATADGKRFFTPGNTGDCLNKLDSAYGANNPLITTQNMADIDRACNYVFQGKGMVNVDSCTTQFDCTGKTDGSIICDTKQPTPLCGQSMTVSGTGQCGAVGAVCSQDFFCAANSASVLLCTAAGTSGAASACSATLPCDHNSRCVNGTCTTLVPVGGACTSNSDCASNGYCNPFVGTCASGLTFAAGSPSCQCFGAGQNCPPGLGGSTTGAGGNGGSAGSSGAAGSPGSAGSNGGAGNGGGAGSNGAAGAGGTG